MNPLVSNLVLATLRHFAAPALRAKLERESKHAAKVMDANQHPFPPQPTDADRAGFVHRAIYRILKESGVPGEIDNAVRDAINERVAAIAAPKLSAGLDTAAAARVVAEAMLAVAESLI